MKYLTPILKSTAKQHFDQLDAESIQYRFGSALKKEAIHKYVDNAKGSFFAIMKIKSDLSLCPVSVMHLVQGSKPGEVEIGISTLKKYQGKGYAKQLMMFAKGIAELNGTETLKVFGVPDNTPMKELAKSVGFKVTQVVGEEFDGTAYTSKKIITDMLLTMFTKKEQQ